MYGIVSKEYIDWMKARPGLCYRAGHEITADIAVLRRTGKRPLSEYVVMSIRPSGAVEVFSSAEEWREPNARDGDRVDGVPGKEPGWPEAFRGGGV